MCIRDRDTTVGRVLFNQAVPATVPFINELATKKSLKKTIADVITRTDFAQCADFLDSIKEMGFSWAFKGGLSFNLGDLVIPSIKDSTLKAAQVEVDEVWENYNMGLITNNERYNQIIDKWTFAAVSYTHLDVYKRQVLMPSQIVFRRNISGEMQEA